MCSFIPSSVFAIVFKAVIRLSTTRLNLQEYEMKYLFSYSAIPISHTNINPVQNYVAVQKTMIVMYEAICSKAVGPKQRLQPAKNF